MLYKDDRRLSSGRVVTVEEEADRMIYQYRYVMVVRAYLPCEDGFCGDNFFLLVEEIGIKAIS
jgi:hypothetical protein